MLEMGILFKVLAIHPKILQLGFQSRLPVTSNRLKMVTLLVSLSPIEMLFRAVLLNHLNLTVISFVLAVLFVYSDNVKMKIVYHI